MNELFAAQVAYAYLHASGIQVKVGSQEAIALVIEAVEGRRNVLEPGVTRLRRRAAPAALARG